MKVKVKREEKNVCEGMHVCILGPQKSPTQGNWDSPPLSHISAQYTNRPQATLFPSTVEYEEAAPGSLSLT